MTTVLDSRNISFVLLMGMSSCFWVYSVHTNTISRVDMINFPIFRLLPGSYWAGFVLLMFSTALCYFRGNTKWYNYVLLPLWTLYIFIGPELMEVTARGYDATDHISGILSLQQGLMSKEWAEFWYAQWPAFFLFVDALSKVSDIGYYPLTKLVSGVFHMSRAILVLCLGRQLFQEQRRTLLFSLLAVAFYWEPQAFDPSPQNMAILLMLFMLPQFFRPGDLSASRRIVLVIGFLALVATHVLTPYVVALLAAFLGLAWVIRSRLGRAGSIRGFSTAGLFAVIFVTYLLYVSGWIVKDALDALRTAAADPLLPARFIIPRTPYQAYAINLIYLNYGVILIWMALIVLRKEFWRGKFVKRFFPLLCVSAPLCVLVPYGFASLPRLYILAVPFIVWFLVEEGTSGRGRVPSRIVVTGFLLTLLVLGFTVRYSIEYVNYVPTYEFLGAKFVSEKMPAYYYLYDVTEKNPQLSAMAEKKFGEQPYSHAFATWWFGLGGMADFALDSGRRDNYIRFHLGDETLSALDNTALNRVNYSIVYTTGDYWIIGYYLYFPHIVR